MRIVFREIKDVGNLERERVIFDVVESATTSSFIVLKSEKVTKEGAFSSRIHDAFWMTSVKVVSGDKIVLYSKGGDDRRRVNSTGSATVFFYWHREAAIWEGADDALLLVEMGDFSVTFASDFSGVDEDSDEEVSEQPNAEVLG